MMYVSSSMLYSTCTRVGDPRDDGSLTAPSRLWSAAPERHSSSRAGGHADVECVDIDERWW